MLQHKKCSQDLSFAMKPTSLPTIIVPARLASVRFPRKLLADAGGKPLILRTAERLRLEVPEYEVFFAVDGHELAEPLQKEGFSVLLTDPELSSGTDRIAQANQSLRRKRILNVQADEPMVERSHILALGDALSKEGVSMSTLAAPFEREEDFLDPNQVKVVLDRKGYAIYFSRAAIPHRRDRADESRRTGNNFGLKHLGMYGYDSSFLESFSTWKQGFLEEIENLEQLRALEHGCRIGVSIVAKATIGVDHPGDLDELDFADLSEITPLLARVYPNGSADVNHFHAAGGMGFVIAELLESGLLDGSAKTAGGADLHDYASEPFLDGGNLVWRAAPRVSGDSDILRPASDPHSATGGLKMLDGNLGKAVIKTSALNETRHVINAPAAIFTTEAEVKAAYQAGDLNRDVVVVLRCQGPMATGMPELHSLTPLLGNLQDEGYKVALVTDGRMSGASGSVPAAIHLCPEAVDGGPIGKIENGDLITLDAKQGTLVADADLETRTALGISNLPAQRGFARSLFAGLRQQATGAEHGAGLNLLERLQ